ncbi:hypothetical protein CHARACLAT_033620 [Characodon lateralis]|uniref:Uncharacterized protein n=1 Tax=Characodon lateralis TaxID=208331 RepID=A0ABU7F947_9TELE|nr:hypothetical protein [Characodon lateralis]
MAGRKRKVQELAVATAAVTHKESDLVLLRTQSEPNRRASPAKVTSQSVPCESVQRFEPERSHYFNGEPRRRLEQDFYSQPCISLAKAFLGKVPVKYVLILLCLFLRPASASTFSRAAQQFLRSFSVFVLYV